MLAGLGQILEVSDNSATMVNKMLSGISAHALDAEHYTEFDLSQLIKTKASELAPLAFDKAQDFTSTGIDNPLPCLGHEILLGEAVSNLIHNAIQHNATGTSIAISLNVQEAQQIIKFAVEDEGSAFSDEEFNEFTQPFRTGGTNPGSTGLGLSIIKDIVRMHQGVLETVKTGNGKIVIMQLPLGIRSY